MQDIVLLVLDAFTKNPYIFCFILAGAFIGTIVHYLRKKKIKKPEDLLSWDWNYLINAFISSLWVTVGSAGLFNAFAPPDGFGLVVVYIAAFLFGYGGKELQEEFIKVVRLLLVLYNKNSLSS